MQEPTTHFVTGATGFLGGALALELLAETPHELACLVRSREDESADERLRRKLAHAARLYGREDLVPEIESRCRALSGDVTLPDCGVDAAELDGVDTVWHVAASLEFDEEKREETLRHNVEGTAAVLSLARAAGARELLYVSTAYVAGRTIGVIREEPAEDPGNANNPYEESKIRAEALVLGEGSVPTRVLRPSIVIGHSVTHATLSRAGIYGSLMGAHQYMQAGIEPTLGGRPLYSPGREDVPCNLIPVDYVARNAVAVQRSGSDARIFHLANATPPTLREVTDAVCDSVGMLRTVFVDSDEGMTDIEKMLANHPQNQFQRPYMTFDRTFDLSNTDAAIGADASRCPLGTAELRRYLDWFVQAEGIETTPTPAGA